MLAILPVSMFMNLIVLHNVLLSTFTELEEDQIQQDIGRVKKSSLPETEQAVPDKYQFGRGNIFGHAPFAMIVFFMSFMAFSLAEPAGDGTSAKMMHL